MISQISVRGYKAIYNARVELGNFTLLIGRNGSGKSSVIEALQWLRDASNLGVRSACPYGSVADLINRRREKIDFDLWYKQSPRHPDVHYTLGVSESFKAVPRVVSEKCVVGATKAASTTITSRKGKRGPTWRWVHSRRSKRFSMNDDNELALGHARQGSSAATQSLQSFLARSVFLRLSPTDIAHPMAVYHERWSPILADTGRDLPALLERLSAAAKQRVANRVASIFPSIEGVDVRGDEKERYMIVHERMRSKGGTKRFDIPSWMLSEGLRRLVAIFALLESDDPRPSLLAIEEVENGLDPWTLQHVLDALRDASSSVQIVLTSHSPFLLDHVPLSDVIFVKRSKGDSSYLPASEIRSAENFSGVLAPGGLYLSGLFDGEPQ